MPRIRVSRSPEPGENQTRFPTRQGSPIRESGLGADHLGSLPVRCLSPGLQPVQALRLGDRMGKGSDHGKCWTRTSTLASANP